jgi:hypothetical protein
MIFLIILVILVITIIYKKKIKEIVKTLIYTSNSDILSEKYKSLNSFKSFLGICIVLNVIGSIICCFYFIDMKQIGMTSIIIIITIFNIWITKKFMLMIDILFDLNNKIDN